MAETSARSTAKKTVAKKTARSTGKGGAQKTASTDASDSGEAKQTKSERTRARILDAAASVLAERGFAGTRLAEVAERAQIQAPAIYYHFESRESLIEQVMTAGISHLVTRVEEALGRVPEGAPYLDRVDLAVRTHLQVQLDESDYARAAVRNSRQVPPELREEYDRLASRYGALWAGLVSGAQERGELTRTVDARATAHLILGTLNGTPEWWRPRQMKAERLLEETTAFVRAALSA